MSDSSKVSYGREGKGRVFLGWGRGSCSFELDFTGQTDEFEQSFKEIFINEEEK